MNVLNTDSFSSTVVKLKAFPNIRHTGSIYCEGEMIPIMGTS